jgi:hypothetical protein
VSRWRGPQRPAAELLTVSTLVDDKKYGAATRFDPTEFPVETREAARRAAWSSLLESLVRHEDVVTPGWPGDSQVITLRVERDPWPD